jgi:hypothetical protein
MTRLIDRTARIQLAMLIAALLGGTLATLFDPGPDLWDTRDFPHTDAGLIAAGSALAVGLAGRFLPHPNRKDLS